MKSLLDSPGFFFVGVAPSNWFEIELPQQLRKSEHAKQSLEYDLPPKLNLRPLGGVLLRCAANLHTS